MSNISQKCAAEKYHAFYCHVHQNHFCNRREHSSNGMKKTHSKMFVYEVIFIVLFSLQTQMSIRDMVSEMKDNTAAVEKRVDEIEKKLAMLQVR